MVDRTILRQPRVVKSRSVTVTELGVGTVDAINAVRIRFRLRVCCHVCVKSRSVTVTELGVGTVDAINAVRIRFRLGLGSG